MHTPGTSSRAEHPAGVRDAGTGLDGGGTIDPDARTSAGGSAAGQATGRRRGQTSQAGSGGHHQSGAAAPAGASAERTAAGRTDRSASVRAHHPGVARRALARPYLIYDSVTPQTIPAHKRVATYATGPFAVQAPQVAGRWHVIWIDTAGTDPAASALDVEPGDATPAVAADWVRQKLTARPNSVAVVYTSLSEWPAVQQAVHALPAHMQSRVRWWIANPTGYPHVVPGSSATQWYWGQNYDISTAEPGF